MDISEIANKSPLTGECKEICKPYIY